MKLARPTLPDPSTIRPRSTRALQTVKTNKQKNVIIIRPFIDGAHITRCHSVRPCITCHSLILNTQPSEGGRKSDLRDYTEICDTCVILL